MCDYLPRILTGKKGCVSGCKSQMEVSAMWTRCRDLKSPLWAGERGLEEGREGTGLRGQRPSLRALPQDRWWAGKGTEQTEWPGLVWVPWQVQWEAGEKAGLGRGQVWQACGQSPGVGGPGSEPGLVDPEIVKGLRARGCHQTPSLVCSRDGVHGPAARRPGGQPRGGIP